MLTQLSEIDMLRARVEYLERCRECAHEMIEEVEVAGKLDSFAARLIEFGLSDYGWPECAPEMLEAALLRESGTSTPETDSASQGAQEAV